MRGGCAVARSMSWTMSPAKMDRCLRAGALALGAAVEIVTIPGYFPLRNDPELAQRCSVATPSGLSERLRLTSQAASSAPRRINRHGRPQPDHAGHPSVHRGAAPARDTATTTALSTTTRPS